MYAKILVDVKAKEVDRLFDYIIPESELNTLLKGMRVIVPFGHMTRLGYVVEIVEQSDLATKEIIEVLDIVPSISDEVFEYINYLTNTNNTLKINIFETVLPSELFLTYSQTITILNEEKLPSHLKELFQDKKSIKYNNKMSELKNSINYYVDNKILKITRSFKQKGNTKYVDTLVFLNDAHYKNKDKYLDLIHSVKKNPNQTRKQLTQDGYSLSSINTLIKNNVFDVIELPEERLVKFLETTKIPIHKLNNEQQKAYETIKESLNTNEIFLLKGITGSGKTEVYMKAMLDVLNNNQTILYLVPELTLVAPLMQQLNSRFNELITHYNPSLSAGERFDAWMSIINNKSRIIVGTKQSIFLPINNLGLIIMDEEQEDLYIQKERVYYNALDILKIKAKYHNIPIILGSATPKITSMYLAEHNTYKLLELTKRATKVELPKISFVDMKRELNEGNTSIFSKKLQKEINKRINNNEQVLLLYNRKGYAQFSVCRSCGYTPKCKHCDVSLTYYKETNELKCSYCGYKEEHPTNCPSCHQKAMRPVGIGIDQVFQQLIKTFPNAKSVKLDANSTSKKGMQEKIWHDFQNNKYDIMIGTKMIAHGLDFPNVTLVGVLMADLELKTPTYLSSEHTYSLLTQMVGRSGRAIKGEAIIQGYDLDHYAIKSINKPYDEFYKEALHMRKIAKYEPYFYVKQLLITNKSYLRSYQDALNIKKELSNYVTQALGPSEPIIKYVNDEYRFIITIKNKTNVTSKDIFELLNNKKYQSTIKFYEIADLI